MAFLFQWQIFNKTEYIYIYTFKNYLLHYYYHLPLLDKFIKKYELAKKKYIFKNYWYLFRKQYQSIAVKWFYNGGMADFSTSTSIIKIYLIHIFIINLLTCNTNLKKFLSITVYNIVIKWLNYLFFFAN